MYSSRSHWVTWALKRANSARFIVSKTAIALSLAICILALPLREALAHGGGLDSHGCHRETATGGYHCHQEEDETDWETAGLVVGGLVALILVLAWLQDDDESSSLRLHVSEDGTADVGYSLGASQQIGVRTTAPADDSENDYLGVYWRLAF